MRSKLLPAVITFSVLSSSPRAQNEVAHYRSTAFASRGGLPQSASVMLLQRIAADQICGRSAITGFRTTLQYDAYPVAQVIYYEVRVNALASATGAPDVTSPALASIGPFTIPATTAPTAWLISAKFSSPVQVPTQLGVPGGDLYSAIVLPAPLPGFLPLSMHMSSNEPMRASAVGYSGKAGVAGLAWHTVTGTGPATETANNAAWDIRTNFMDDVCQGFAQRATVNNFGYAGLFPDTVNGEAPGWRVRCTASPGSQTLLLISSRLSPTPVQVPGIRGLLCIDPTFALLLAVGTTVIDPSQPAGTSQALIGPFPSALAGGVNLFAQAVTLDSGSRLVSFSTACRTNF
jgi:hypothetical protein